jgi:hypothetical protein
MDPKARADLFDLMARVLVGCFERNEEKLKTEAPYNPKILDYGVQFEIKPEHLARKAIVYLRQSSEKQVRQNKESQRLQHDVAERTRALDWK